VDTARAWAEIDLDALARNLGAIRGRVGPGVAVLLVAKADAYGHGAVAVGHHALKHGADAVGVTACSEADELRRAGIRERILLLGTILEDEAPWCLELGLEVEIPSFEHFWILEEAAGRRRSKARVHVKVDTGMHRLGVPPEEALELLAAVRASKNLELAGLMTHVADPAGARSARSNEQLRRFEWVVQRARRRGLLAGRDVWVHAANSACVLAGQRPLYDAVRPGIAAYGVAPDPALATIELAPVMSVRTRVVHLGNVPVGGRVGYGGTFVARRETRLATLPIGYDDGVDLRLSNRGHVLVHGIRAPIVGRISMDYTTVDVTDVARVRLGDPVTLIGRDGNEELRVEEHARTIDTLPYALLCSIGKRVRRIYRSEALESSSRPRLAEPV